MKKILFLIFVIFVPSIFGAQMSPEQQIIYDISHAKGFFINKKLGLKVHQSYEGLIELYKNKNSSKLLKTEILDALSRAWSENGEATCDPFIAIYLQDNGFAQQDIEKLKLDDNSASEYSENIKYGVGQHHGKRPYQEDRYDIQTGANNVKYFAVFDGHGGDKVSEYAKENLYNKFLSKLEIEDDVEQALLDSFKELDSELPAKLGDEVAKEQGSTAIIVVIKDDIISVANVGDSRAVASVNGKADALSIDHKPNQAHEKIRIERLGAKFDLHGFRIVHKESGDALAVSRALGDTKYAPYVIAVPHIFEYDMACEFIILASDGIWDVIANQEAVDLVANQLSKNMNLNEIAKHLISVAFNKGSGDNMTAIIIKLPKKSEPNDSFVSV